MSAGIGLVLLLRWFWWRINAWSEISALIAPYLIYPVLRYGFDLDVIGDDFGISLIIIVLWSTSVWIGVTFLTKPEKDEKLIQFYTKVYPGGIGWKRIAAKTPEVKGDIGYFRMFLNWFAGSLLVLFALFGIGKIIFKEYVQGFIFIGLAVLLVLFILYNLKFVENINKKQNEKA